MRTSPAPTITVDHVSKWYGSVMAINDVSLNVYPGITGLLGPNGAGKTTLLHMITGLTKPSQGSIQILGQSARLNSSLYRRIGVMPEHESVYNFFTGRELVEIAAKLHGLANVKKATDDAIHAVNLSAVQHRMLGAYSRGMRQRMRLATALVHQPEVLILDEPLKGTDPRQQIEFRALMHKLASFGHTILISSHVLDEIEALATNVLLIVHGKLAASGDPRSIREKIDERPYEVRIVVNKPRAVAAELLQLESVGSVSIDHDGSIIVLSKDVAIVQRAVTKVAAEVQARIYSVIPLDDSLETVFSYVVNR